MDIQPFDMTLLSTSICIIRGDYKQVIIIYNPCHKRSTNGRIETKYNIDCTGRGDKDL